MRNSLILKLMGAFLLVIVISALVIYYLTTQATQNALKFIQVSVSDTGSGIAPEDIPWVFDRFYRADRSRTRASGGSGLGLAIVKQLVEAHGGHIAAHSPVFHEKELAYGTRITFTLLDYAL